MEPNEPANDDELIHALVNESASAAQFVIADDLLRHSRSARRRYVEQIFIVSMLRNWREQSRRAVADERLPRARQYMRASLAVALLAVVAVGWLLFRGGGPASVAEPSPVDVSSETAESRPLRVQLMAGEDCLLRGTALAGKDVLVAGSYELSRGAISLHFENGVEVSLEAPAQFELVHASRIVLHEGRIRARVPESGVGFVVATPEADIEDLGTEFGVQVVRNRSTELQVFSGQVALHAPGMKPVHVHEGSSMRLGQGGVLEQSPAEDLDVVTTEDISFRRWKAFSQTLRQDPSTVFYYDFEPDPRRPGVLPDRSVAGPRVNGKVHGSLWTSGRWQGKGALLLDHDGDYVELNVPGEYDACTLHAWLCVNRIHAAHHAILTANESRHGQHHWQILRTGELLSVVKGALNVRTGSIQLGQWMHLAIVLDRSRHQACYYIDGKPAAEARLSLGVPITFGPTTLGAYQVESANAGTIPRRFLRGWIDELALFSRAFSNEEVFQLYERGRIRQLPFAEDQTTASSLP